MPSIINYTFSNMQLKGFVLINSQKKTQSKFAYLWLSLIHRNEYKCLKNCLYKMLKMLSLPFIKLRHFIKDISDLVAHASCIIHPH